MRWVWASGGEGRRAGERRLAAVGTLHPMPPGSDVDVHCQNCCTLAARQRQGAEESLGLQRHELMDVESSLREDE